jgi:hypothetical protein
VADQALVDAVPFGCVGADYEDDHIAIQPGVIVS